MKHILSNFVENLDCRGNCPKNVPGCSASLMTLEPGVNYYVVFIADDIFRSTVILSFKSTVRYCDLALYIKLDNPGYSNVRVVAVTSEKRLCLFLSTQVFLDLCIFSESPEQLSFLT